MIAGGKKSSRRQGIIAGFFGVLTVASGIVSTVLYHVFLRNFYVNSLTHTGPQFDFWWTPVPFIFPGLLGIAAAVQRNKPLFAVYLAFALTTLLITGIFFIIIVIFIVTLPSEYSRSECTGDGYECRCLRILQDVFSKPTGYKDCDVMIDMVIYGNVATGFFILAWVLCFAGAMLSCFTCCYMQKQRDRAIVAFKDRHCPSIRISHVQPGPTTRRAQQGTDNPSYVYF